MVLDIEVREKSPTEQWVSFPGYKTVKDKKTGTEKKMSRVYIKDQDLRQSIFNEVLGKYNNEVKEGTTTPATDGAVNETSPFPF